MEERLRTARILASDDEEDEEHVARRRRTRTQIERDLNNPKVHKRIVENLYFAYKMRVRRRRRRRRLAFSLEFVAENKTFPKLSMCGVLGLNDLAPPRISLERFCGSSLLTTGGVRDPNDPMSHFAARARAPRSIDRSTPFAPPSSAREKERLGKIRATFPVGAKVGIGDTRGGDLFFFLTWQIFFSSCLDVVCVCVCARKLTLCLARKKSPLSLSLSRTLFLSRARVTTERTKEELRLVVLVHFLRVFLPHDSLLTEKSGRGV